jgi:hypothetical protein
VAWGGPNVESWTRPVAQRGQEMAPERRCSTEFRPSGARAVRGQMDAASTPPSACLMDVQQGAAAVGAEPRR